MPTDTTDRTTEKSAGHDLQPWLRRAEAREVPIVAIRTDGGTQQRAAALDAETVEEMAQKVVDAQEEAASDIIDHPFPFIELYFDGEDYWLADGFYRCASYERANIPVIGANIREGSQRDAILHSCHANASHGTRRTNEDKRKAVRTMLLDEEWRRLSFAEIGEVCGVSDWLVRDVQRDLEEADPTLKVEVRVDRSGREYNPETLGVAGRKGAEKANETKAKKKAEESGEAPPAHDPEADLTDQEWLDSLPIYPALKEAQGEPVIFEGAALSWRTLDQSNFFDHMRYHLRAFGKSQEDELSRRYDDLLRVGHPSEWGLCPHCAGSLEVRVDGNGHYIDRSDPRWGGGRGVTCTCNGGFVFEGGIRGE